MFLEYINFMRVFNFKLVQNIKQTSIMNPALKIIMKSQTVTILCAIFLILSQSQKPCSSTAQCTSVGSICLGGRCQKVSLPNPTPCSKDIQCSIGFHCANNACKPYPFVACTSDLECQSGFHCPSRQCIPSSLPSPGTCSSNAQCLTGFYCFAGVCTPLPPITGCNAPQFYQAPHACLKTCNHPDFVNCPSVVSRAVPPFRYCALLSTGVWSDFKLACEVCSGPFRVIAIDDQPCSCKQKGCPSGQQCKQNVCENITVSQCINIMCPPNYLCRYGICVSNKPPHVTCETVHCAPGYKCLNGQCVLIVIPDPNVCTHVICPHGKYCNKGTCIPIIIPPYDLCSTIYCAPGTYCINGMCKPYLPPSICGSYSQFTPIGCLKSCSHPDFLNCPGIFPLIYKPKFCGYTIQNEWISFTFECQACKSTSPLVIAVDNEPCSCKHYGCQPGYLCQDHVCVPKTPPTQISCASILCSVGFYCLNNNCLPIPPIVTCSNVFCAPGFACYENQCYPQVPSCGIVNCPYGFYCVNNQCVQNKNSCDIMRCPSGFFCQNNNCLQIVNPSVLNICANLICAYGHHCKENNCIPIIYPTEPNVITCDRILCAQGATCINNQCVFIDKPSIKIPINPCHNITCVSGSYCLDGKCTGKRTKLKTHAEQTNGKTNERHSYIEIKDYFDTCFKVNCPQGYYCWQGICESMI